LNILSAVFLGIIQGLTEFLPISSTAHLTLGGKILGLIDVNHPESWTAFIAVIQLGTLAAVLLFFRRDIWSMASALARDVFSNGDGHGFAGYSHHSRMGLFIILGTIPVAVIGLVFKNVIEGSFTKTTLVIAGSLIVLAGLLWTAERVAKHTRSIENVGWLDALIIGFAQACALIPGSSRSGTTITAGLFLGLSREAAARFSFLLSVPAVFASGLYELSKVHGMSDVGVGNLVTATIVAGIAGYASIAWLLKYLMTNTTMVFVWYRVVLGILLILLVSNGILQP
jgi:undecaprenyl-diphosphatase